MARAPDRPFAAAGSLRQSAAAADHDTAASTARHHRAGNWHRSAISAGSAWRAFAPQVHSCAAGPIHGRVRAPRLLRCASLLMAPSCGTTRVQALPRSSEERPFADLVPRWRSLRIYQMPDGVIAVTPLEPWRRFLQLDSGNHERPDRFVSVRESSMVDGTSKIRAVHVYIAGATFSEVTPVPKI